MVRDLVTDKGCEPHVALHQVHIGHAAKNFENLRAEVFRVCQGSRVAFGVVAEFREQRQRVHREAFARRRIEDFAQDREPERLFGLGQI